MQQLVYVLVVKLVKYLCAHARTHVCVCVLVHAHVWSAVCLVFYIWCMCVCAFMCEGTCLHARVFA